MTLAELKKHIGEDYNDVSFSVDGKSAGVTSTVENYIPTFQVWYGDEIKEYNDIDQVVNDQFYGGRSLIDLCKDGKTEFWFS